mmetsp:Transcript_63251/g.160508  ORF Transcript_63251/g.160508 Transcript_63251/m.160508 type:complete len:229 (+) Transcript_63251:348-1034(+)
MRATNTTTSAARRAAKAAMMVSTDNCRACSRVVPPEFMPSVCLKPPPYGLSSRGPSSSAIDSRTKRMVPWSKAEYSSTSVRHPTSNSFGSTLSIGKPATQNTNERSNCRSDPALRLPTAPGIRYRCASSTLTLAGARDKALPTACRKTEIKAAVASSCSKASGGISGEAKTATLNDAFDLFAPQPSPPMLPDGAPARQVPSLRNACPEGQAQRKNLGSHRSSRQSSKE